MKEITLNGVRENYPSGRAYDNLFNAEHRDVMVEVVGFTSAEHITVDELIEFKST